MPAKLHSKWCSNWRFSSRLAQHLGFTPLQRTNWLRANYGMALLAMVLPLLLSLVTLLTNWDLALADAAFDVATSTFPWRHTWIAEVFNHVILKQLFSLIGAGFVMAAGWDLVSPRSWTWLRRFQFRVVALSALMVPALISIFKHMSSSHCPWDLVRYGGTQPYIKLFAHFPAGLQAGQCMPAGHVSIALWMISLAVFCMPYQPARAAKRMTLFLLLSLGVGWIQQLRGAHFLTHTLWSVWVAFTTIFLITLCLDRWPTRQSACNVGTK